MPARICLLVISLLLSQPWAAAQELLEPSVGGEALLLNCVLYDPTCLKAPATAFQPSQPTATAAQKPPPALPAPAPPKSATTPGKPQEPTATGTVRPRPGVGLRVKG